ncbi:MAG: fibronectin type III-like domain-contianing protein [Prevotella sp.]|nr:fibronectin type III-like domain-contianing protein [Prevotella sp.]
MLLCSSPSTPSMRGFDKIGLQPQETRTVTLHLPADDLAFVGWDGKRHLEEGEFRLTIADKQVSVWCEKTIVK